MQNLKVKIISTVVTLGLFLGSAVPAFAHAVVKPNTAGVGAYTDFSLGVPSEKDSATVAVKLFIPEGINSITPIVKSGWKVEVINSDKTGEPDDDGNTSPIPAAIVWTGGQVPAHQKDFFTFSTQVPAKETELDWKVEQTYADGSVMSWTKSESDQPKDEKGNSDFSKFGPFSKTMVVNDLKASPSSQTGAVSEDKDDNSTKVFSIVALALAAIALGMQFRKR